MADLIYEFGADVTQFNASIADVTKEIKRLKDVLKTATGAEIPKLNAEIAALQTSLSNLKSVGVPASTAFAKVEDSAKGARIALTNVSQIAQDLPFGFIGIQNNIPGLVQSFGKLSTESGGTVAALKAMGSALAGPAGILLAFSAVSSIVTVVIQKYGSLGAALDALFGKTNLLVKAQQDYNKALAQATGSSATEVAEIKILVGVLTDLSQPLKDRQAAYVELQKIRPDVIAGQKLENISTQEAIKLIDENAKSVLNLIVLKSKESAISSVLNKNAEDLVKLLIEENDLKKRIAKTDNDAINFAKSNNDFDEISARLKQGLTKELNNNKKQQEALNKVAQEYITILAPTIQGIAETDRRTKELTDSLKEQEKVTKAPKVKAAKEKKGLDILDLERKARIAAQKLQEQADKNRLKFLNDQLKAEEKLTKEFFKQQDAIMKADAEAFTKQNLGSFGFLDIELVQENLNNAKLAFQKAYEDLNLIFFEPLQNLFNDLITKGVVNFKDFGDAILKTLTQIATKIIASGILKLLASLMTGGAVGVAKAGLAAVGTEGLAAFLAGGGAVNFGGVQGGGLGMSGSVNLTLRGTDLVGAINRTNSQIQRVG
jgi:hypothetical protein